MIVASVPLRAQLQGQYAVRTLVADSVSSISEFREADSLVDRLHRDRVLRLTSREDDPLVPDRTHERFRQYYSGVPVFGSGVTRQTAGGVTTSLYGSLHLGINVESTPTLSADEAAGIVERLGNLQPGGSMPLRLVILPDPEQRGAYRLVYEGRVFTGTQLMAYFVDGFTGDLVWSYSDLKTQQPTLPCKQSTPIRPSIRASASVSTPQAIEAMPSCRATATSAPQST